MLTPRTLLICAYYQLGAVVVLALLGLWVRDDIALGVLAGGSLMTANFWFLRNWGAKAFGQGTHRALYATLLAIKMVIGMALIGVLLFTLPVNVAGFAVGMATLFVGIGGGLLHVSRAGAAPREEF